MDVNYREDPFNTPHKSDGTPIECGPWLRVGYVDGRFDGKYMCANLGGMSRSKLFIAIQERDGTCEDNRAALFATPATNFNQHTVSDAGFLDDDIPVGKFFDESRDYKERPTSFNTEISKIPRTGERLDKTVPRYYRASGIAYKEVGSDKINEVPLIKDGRWFGTYNTSPTGLLAIVSDHGVLYLAERNYYTEGKLQELGFVQSRTLEVPFSHGERPIPSFRSFESRVGSLCEHMASTDVTAEQKDVLARTINTLLGDAVEPPFKPQELGSARDSMVKAITAKYPDSPDKLDAFLGALNSQLGGGDKNPLNNYKSPPSGFEYANSSIYSPEGLERDEAVRRFINFIEEIKTKHAYSSGITRSANMNLADGI